MVNAQVETGENERDDDAEEKDGVELNVFDEAGFLTEEPHLGYDDDDKNNDDDGQRCFGARLLIQVVSVETLNGDEAEGIIVQGADPACAQPQNSLFNLRSQASERATDAHLVVHDPSDKHGWQELAHNVGE